MNIDLFISTQNIAGLVSDEPFEGQLAGIMFDPETGLISLEFADIDPIEMNIPVAQNLCEALLPLGDIHIGVLEHNTFSDARQLPLILLNNPFGGAHQGRFPAKPRRSVLDFERFMKTCAAGQPVHRDDLGDETSAESVMSGVNPAVLQFAPHLTQQRTMEAAPKVAPRGPAGPAMGGMGGGGGGGIMGGHQGGGHGGHSQSSHNRSGKRDDE